MGVTADQCAVAGCEARCINELIGMGFWPARKITGDRVPLQASAQKQEILESAFCCEAKKMACIHVALLLRVTCQVIGIGMKPA